MFDFVSLVYNNKKEIEFLKLQLLSFKFVDINIINNIYILFNDDKENSEFFNEEYKNNIEMYVPPYLLPKITIINITDLIILNEKYLSNWISQQFAKIYISKIINSKYYIVLDNKNIFIKEVNLNTFMIDNKIKMYFSTHNDDLLNCYNNCFHYFDIPKYNPYNHPLYIQTTTPFVFITQECKNIIDFVEDKENINFYYFFNSKKYTEFFFYFAWLCFTNNYSCYIFLDKYIDNIIIGPHDPKIYVWNSWESKIDYFNKYNPSTFSISSKCIQYINDEYKNNIIALLHSLLENQEVTNILTSFFY